MILIYEIHCKGLQQNYNYTTVVPTGKFTSTVLIGKQKCQVQMVIVQYKDAAKALISRGINTTHQCFQMRYVTLILVKGLKSYQLK